MGVSIEQYRARVGCFNVFVCKQSPKVNFSKNQIILYMDKTTKQTKNDMTKQQFGTMSLTSGLRIYIINQSHIFNAYRCN